MSLMKRIFAGIGMAAVAALVMQMVAPQTTHAVASTLVSVTNSLTNPVPVSDIKDQRPFQQTILFNQTSTVCTNFVCTVNFTRVPAGYRLVITHASAFYKLGNGNSGGSLPNVSLATNADVSETLLQLPLPLNGGSNIYIISSPVTYYVEQGETPTLFLGGSFVTNDGSNSAQATIVGYYVPVS